MPRPVLAGSPTTSSVPLTHQQRRAIDMLLNAQTQSNTAKALGISERTLRRWLALAPVQEELASRSRHLRQAATLALAFGAAGAAKSLVSMAIGGIPPSSARVSAARSVLELLERACDLEAVLERVAELERLVGASEVNR